MTCRTGVRFQVFIFSVQCPGGYIRFLWKLAFGFFMAAVPSERKRPCSHASGTGTFIKNDQRALNQAVGRAHGAERVYEYLMNPWGIPRNPGRSDLSWQGSTLAPEQEFRPNLTKYWGGQIFFWGFSLRFYKKNPKEFFSQPM